MDKRMCALGNGFDIERRHMLDPGVVVGETVIA
jgi:hypothetical protein